MSWILKYAILVVPWITRKIQRNPWYFQCFWPFLSRYFTIMTFTLFTDANTPALPVLAMRTWVDDAYVHTWTCHVCLWWWARYIRHVVRRILPKAWYAGYVSKSSWNVTPHATRRTRQSEQQRWTALENTLVLTVVTKYTTAKNKKQKLGRRK